MRVSRIDRPTSVKKANFVENSTKLSNRTTSAEVPPSTIVFLSAKAKAQALKSAIADKGVSSSFSKECLYYEDISKL